MLNVLRDRAQVLAIWLISAPVAVFTLLLLVIAFFRNGLTFQIIPTGSITSEMDSFPEPSGTNLSISYGLRTVLWITGAQSDDEIRLASLALTIVALVVSLIVIALVRDGLRRRILLAIWLLGPAATIIFGNVGRNDVLLLTGSLAIAVIADRRWRPAWVIAGSILMVLANPEQALVAATIFLLLTFVTQLQPLRRYAIWTFAISILAFTSLSIWARTIGTITRTDLFMENLRPSIGIFVSNLPLVLFSGYGIL
jgi:hypothetical protein